MPCTQIVYRVENAFGRGPYVAGAEISWKFFDVNQHPSPIDDFSVFSGVYEGDPIVDNRKAFYSLIYEYLFGFPSKEAALRWFGEEGLRDLAEEGFKLRTIQGTDVLVSDSGKQLIFKRLDTSNGT